MAIAILAVPDANERKTSFKDSTVSVLRTFYHEAYWNKTHRYAGEFVVPEDGGDTVALALLLRLLESGTANTLIVRRLRDIFGGLPRFFEDKLTELIEAGRLSIVIPPD